MTVVTVTPVGPAGSTPALARADLSNVPTLPLHSASGGVRWELLVDSTAETGSNAGSDLLVMRKKDDGTDFGVALIISRATGLASFVSGLRVGSATVGQANALGAGVVGAGTMLLITNESGGAVIAFSDGANWRRLTDRAVIS